MHLIAVPERLNNDGIKPVNIAHLVIVFTADVVAELRVTCGETVFFQRRLRRQTLSFCRISIRRCHARLIRQFCKVLQRFFLPHFADRLPGCRHIEVLLCPCESNIKQAAFIFNASIVAGKVECFRIEETGRCVAVWTFNAIRHKNNRKSKPFSPMQCHYLNGINDACRIFTSAGIVGALCIVSYKPAKALNIFKSAVAAGAFIIRNRLTQATQIVHLDLVFVCMEFIVIHAKKFQDISIEPL